MQELDPRRFETVAVLKRLAAASRELGELKGAAASIPHRPALDAAVSSGAGRGLCLAP